MQKHNKRVDIYYLNFHSHIEQLNSSWMDHLENWCDNTYGCSFSEIGGILICLSTIFDLPICLFHFWSMSQSRYHKADVTNMLFHWTNVLSRLILYKLKYFLASMCSINGLLTLLYYGDFKTNLPWKLELIDKKFVFSEVAWTNPSN